MADERYGTFNKKTSEETLEAIKNNPGKYSTSDKEKYKKDSTDIKEAGDKYTKIAIGTGVLSGVLIIAGSVGIFFKKPKTDTVKLSFVPSTEGFMAGATLSW